MWYAVAAGAVVLLGLVAFFSLRRRSARRRLVAAGEARAEARGLGRDADAILDEVTAAPVEHAAEDAADGRAAALAAADAREAARALPAPVDGVVGGQRPRSRFSTDFDGGGS